MIIKRKKRYPKNTKIKSTLQVIIDCLGVGLLKSKDEIVSMHVTQVKYKRNTRLDFFGHLSETTCRTQPFRTDP